MKLIAAALALLLPALPAAAQETDYRVLRLAQEAVENGWEITDEADLWTAYAEANGIEASEEVIEGHLLGTAKASRRRPSSETKNLAQQVLRAYVDFEAYAFGEEFTYQVRNRILVCGVYTPTADTRDAGIIIPYQVNLFRIGEDLRAMGVRTGDDAKSRCDFGTN
ncbi:hypothetical protein [Chachezhania sediminis]|uniref:hypothetical protein n=1 Tax=Chachezhania sediminis TaxID=2599291 RepID=UPI00131DF522|nr:hypothetical protein [Chachezhania sediminis]